MLFLESTALLPAYVYPKSLEASSERPGAGTLFKFLLKVEQAFNLITSWEAEAG